MSTIRNWQTEVFRPQLVQCSEFRRMRARGLHCAPMMILLGTILSVCISPRPVIGQSTPAQPQAPSSGQSQIQPVPLPHLYWHFLVYLNFLDSRAAELQGQGRNGNGLRNDLQHRLGFSDADFAPLRASSVRLASELKPLNDQAKSLAAARPSSSSATQWKALTAQREAYVNAEISSLRQALPPDKLTAFESFLTQFFAPKNIVAPSNPAATHSAPAVHP